MLTTLRAWGAGLKLEHYPKDTHTPRMPRCGATPIWPNSTRFQSLTPGPNSMWKRLLNWLKATPCFHYLSFNLKFTIPGSHFFRYLQLSHAFSCQFSHSNPQLIQPSLEDVLRLDCIKKKNKKTTSQIYSHLLRVSLPAMEKLRARWLQDVPELDGDNIWDFPFQSLVSLRDRLTQFKIIHRAYYTSYRLHKINPRLSLECWRCGGAPGDFTHIFWTYPAIEGFWEEVLYIWSSFWSATSRYNLPSQYTCWDWLSS